MEECGFLNTKINKEKILLKTGNKKVQTLSQTLSDNVKIPEQKWYRDNSSRYYIQKHIEQEKYNLLREESEGYSKIIVILNQNCIHFDQQQIDQLGIQIQKVVHFFNLEILKVIDLILESFEIALGSFVDQLSESDCYILQKQEVQNIINVYTQFINIFLVNSEKKQNILASLLGFKLSYILNTQDISTFPRDQNPKKIIPYNLILLIAILIREDYIVSEQILPYFIKKNKQLEKDNEEKVINIKFEEATDDVETYHQILQTLYDKKYLGLETNIIDPKVKLQVQLEFDIERKKAQSLRQNQLPYNYVLWLITCLIQINDYDDAEILIGSFWGDEKIDLTIHKDLLLSLNSYLEASIPISNEKMVLFWHKQKHVSKYIFHSKGLMELGQKSVSDVLIFNLQKILKIQYYFISTNTQIFLRLMESINKYLLQPNENQDESIKQFAFKISGEYLLPALCLVNEQNPNLDNELWKIFEKMKYQERFQYYQYLLGKVYLSNINMLNKLVELVPRVIKWTKLLSIERQQIELMKNETIKISNGGNTLIVANQIVKICSNYNNLFKPLILSMEKQVYNSLALDMVSFSLIKNLNDNQESYKRIDSEANPPISLTYISEFASIFYKNFPQVELLPLIQYVVNRLVDGNHTYEALILSSLIQSMSGWKDLEISQLNEKQLQCLAGGIVLKIDIMEQSAEFKKSQKSQKRALQNVFYSEQNLNKDQNGSQIGLSLSFKLMANLAKQCKHIINNLETEDISLIQNFYDRIHQIFIQIVDTVYYINQDQEKYKKLMPKKDQISSTFVKQFGGIPYQYAFYILRRSFNLLADMSESDLQELTFVYVDIFDSYLQNNINVCNPNYSKNLSNNEVDANWSENSQDNQDDFPYFDEEQFLIQKNTNKWKNFKQEIFAIFWQLELQDIELPAGMYEEQIKLKEKEIIKKSQDGQQSENDRDQKKINKEVDSLQKIKQELKDEFNKVQKIRYQKTSEFLKKKLPILFQQIQDENGVSNFFVQYCIYPRLMFSPADAIFCIKFLYIIVDLKLDKINILNIFAQIMKSIIPTIHCCTSNESENIGVFFMEWFKMIDRWSRGNEEGKKIWENECAKYQGFSRKIGLGLLDIITQEEYKQKIAIPINYRFLQFLKMCLKNPKKQYIKTKSALKILYRIRSVFPKERKIGDDILKELKQILDMNKEIQQDIWTLANRYHNDLSDILSKLPIAEQQINKTIINVQNNPQNNQKIEQQNIVTTQQNSQKEIINNKKQGDIEKNFTAQTQQTKVPDHHKDQQQQFQKDVDMKNEDRNTRNTSNRENQNLQQRENDSKQSLLGKRKIQSQIQNNDNRENLQNKKQNIDDQQRQEDNNKNQKQNEQKIGDYNQEKATNNQIQEKKRIEKQTIKSAEHKVHIQNQNQVQNKKSELQQLSEINQKQKKQNEENEKSQQNIKQQGIAAEIIEKVQVTQKILTIDGHQQIQKKEIVSIEQNPANQQKEQVLSDFQEALRNQYKQQNQKQTNSKIIVNEKISNPPNRKDDHIPKHQQSHFQQPVQRSQFGQNSDISQKQQNQENMHSLEKNVNQQSQKFEKQQHQQNENIKIQKSQIIDHKKDKKMNKEDDQQNLRNSKYKEKNHEQSHSNQKRQIDSQDYREYEQNYNQQSYQHKANLERVHIDNKMEDSFKSNSKNRNDETKWNQRNNHSQQQQFFSNEKLHLPRVQNQNDKQNEQNRSFTYQRNNRDDKNFYTQNQGQYQQQNQQHRSSKQSGQRNHQN